MLSCFFGPILFVSFAVLVSFFFFLSFHFLSEIFYGCCQKHAASQSDEIFNHYLYNLYTGCWNPPTDSALWLRLLNYKCSVTNKILTWNMLYHKVERERERERERDHYWQQTVCSLCRFIRWDNIVRCLWTVAVITTLTIVLVMVIETFHECSAIPILKRVQWTSNWPWNTTEERTKSETKERIAITLTFAHMCRTKSKSPSPSLLYRITHRSMGRVLTMCSSKKQKLFFEEPVSDMKYCGYDLTPDFISNENYICMGFSSNHNVTYKSFSATITFWMKAILTVALASVRKNKIA